MSDFPYIDLYYADLNMAIIFGGSVNEGSVRRHFANLLSNYASQAGLGFADELALRNNKRPDGTLKDKLRLDRGYWEAKDIKDDIDEQIKIKLLNGYPQTNILFENSHTLVLIQDGIEVDRIILDKGSVYYDGEAELDRVLRKFINYRAESVAELKSAQDQFARDLPAVLKILTDAVVDAEINNKRYISNSAALLSICQKSINEYVNAEQIREMVIQHLLTRDIIRKVFGAASEQFYDENSIAGLLTSLSNIIYQGQVRSDIDSKCLNYYEAVGKVISPHSQFSEKEQFLKNLYQNFYQIYNPKSADAKGIVYTPPELVNFMIRCGDYLYHREFGKHLGDPGVNILDPATGTGTFITHLLDFLPQDQLDYKYRNEIHANEIDLMPYYIANILITQCYRELGGQYVEFPGGCLVDTLNINPDRHKQASEGMLQDIIGSTTEDNLFRTKEQEARIIHFILGNPPYNASQQNYNDGNANIKHDWLNKRVRDSYTKLSNATKTKYEDPFYQFFRWASDRIDNDQGMLCFVTNRSYIDAISADGFRKSAIGEFTDLYIVDLGGDNRLNPGSSNVFDIRTGVAICFLVKNSDKVKSGRAHYYTLDDTLNKDQKLAELNALDFNTIAFTEIAPDVKGNWLNQSESDFAYLVLLTNKSKSKDPAIFNLCSPAIKTNRDNTVYDYDLKNLRNKVSLFINEYEDLLDADDRSFPTVIKWSRDLKNEFNRNKRINYNNTLRVKTMFRPFVDKWYYAERILSDVLTQNHFATFGSDLKKPNTVICITDKSEPKFQTLAVNKPVDVHFMPTSAQCIPLYLYDPKTNKRTSNVTQFGLKYFRDHYNDPTITAEYIFYYIYAMLHDPNYRERYANDLRQELPRVYLYDDFRSWSDKGKELMDLHVNFESTEPYQLTRVDNPKAKVNNVHCKINKDNTIKIDWQTILTGVPESAWEYQLGARSAIGWVLNQYSEKKVLAKQDPIAAKYNNYHFADYKERVIDLVSRVCTVSVETVRIVGELEEL